MSGHHNFDHTVQEANLWLHKIDYALHLDDTKHAYPALRATLHALRDQLPAEDAVHLAAQLPVAVRGLFFEGWKLSRVPSAESSIEGFTARLDRELPPGFPMDARTVARGVFAVLWEQLDPGETAKVIDRLPPALKNLWPATAQRG